MANDPSSGLLPEYTAKKRVPVYGYPGQQIGTEEVDATDEYKIPGAVLPNRPSQQRDIYNRQLKGAKDYLARFKENSDRAYGTYVADAQAGSREGIKKIRDDFNARGLYGSGGQAKAETSLYSDLAKSLAQKRAQINQGLLSNLNQLEGNAFSAATQLAAPGPDTANAQLDAIASNAGIELSNQQRDAQLYGGIASGIGSLGGLTLAELMSGQKTQTGTARPPKYVSI